jgi:AcrR family transcriptional regulator
MSIETPKRSDAVRNRARVLEAAAQVFAERGLDAGVPEIAARAGVGKATVYRSFPTKDHLIAAILEERMDWFERRAREAAQEPDAGRAFRALLLAAAERQAADAALASSLVPIKTTPQFDEVRRRAAAAMDELVRKGIEQGALRPDARPDEVRHLLTGAFQVLRESGERDLATWRRYTELVADAFTARSG